KQRIDDQLDLVAHDLPELLGGERLHFDEDTPLPFAGTDHPGRLVVLRLADLAQLQQDVAETVFGRVALRENDIALVEMQRLLQLAAVEGEQAGAPRNAEVFKNLGKAEGFETPLEIARGK